jgi:hypothetical protein
MSAKDREVAESAFDKNKRREAEINSALQQEHARQEAVIKNMHRLRSLRLKREAQGAPAKRKSHWLRSRPPNWRPLSFLALGAIVAHGRAGRNRGYSRW